MKRLLPTLACGLLFASTTVHSAPPEPPAAPAPTAAPDAKPAPEAKPAAEPKRPDPKWNIRTDVLMVAMPQEKLLPLLPDLRDPKKIDAAVEQLLAAVQHKEAILTGYPTVYTVDGARGVTEAIVEKRYAVEYQPPGTLGATPAGASAPSPASTPPAPPVPPAPAAAAEAGEFNNVAMPTAFETRNVGPTLEVKPRVSDRGDLIYLDVVPQRVELLNFDTFDAAKTASGKTVKIEQPRFFTSKATVSLAIPNGQRTLVAVHLLAKPENYMEVFVLQAFATPIK